MALPLNIDDLIHQRKVESARIEYKKDWNPEKVLHSVCAFANDIDNWGGGYIRSRFYRNRRIGEFLKELDLAEGRNTGIGKIVRAMRENGSPDPEFFNPETRSFMTVILPIHEAFRAETVEKVSGSTEKSVEKSTEKNGLKTTEKTVVKTVVKTGSKSEKVVECLRMNPFATRQDLARDTGLSVRGVEWNLRKLSQLGIIRRVGPDKGGHWEVVGNA